MTHDHTTDPADARVNALYQAHIADAGQPSPESDARILALAQEALARPAAKTVAPGWRSWLKASWFGPGLAFATIASLSVVIVALMPKEDISVERAITGAPGSAPLASPAAPVTAAATPMQAPAPSAESAAAFSATSASGAKQAPDGQSKPKPARSNESARPLPQRGGPIDTVPAASLGKAITQRVETARAPAPKAERPNPFPAQSPPVAGGRADQVAAAPGVAPPAVAAPAPRAAPAAAAAADAGLAQRAEKPSLLSEPTESRINANQPVPEVRDSAPTYPNEVRPSFPLPNTTYVAPRASARDAAGLGAAKGSLAGRGSAPQLQLAPARKEDAAERRATDKSALPAATAPATASLAGAPPLRDPAEWIKAIQKLRTEGKSEQVIKELTEFRRHYPLYPLPDELKQLK